MSPDLSATVDASVEIAALIEQLHATDQRLEQLLQGEVDSVTDRQGRTTLLRRAQGHLRQSDIARQAAILGALPAHIALLDARGGIVSVNTAWREFSDASARHAPGHAVGLNYLDICEQERGEGSADAALVAVGIRAVLAGKNKSFSLEYSCHSATRQRWLVLSVTPLVEDSSSGAVVMHIDVTERKQAADEHALMSLRTEQNERKLNLALSSITDFVQLYDKTAGLFTPTRLC